MPSETTPRRFLTPQLRDQLFRELAPEGTAVLTADGTIYKGRRMGECGLSQRGLMFFREICRTSPPWGEDHWDKFRRR